MYVQYFKQFQVYMTDKNAQYNKIVNLKSVITLKYDQNYKTRSA